MLLMVAGAPCRGIVAQLVIISPAKLRAPAASNGVAYRTSQKHLRLRQVLLEFKVGCIPRDLYVSFVPKQVGHFVSQYPSRAVRHF